MFEPTREEKQPPLKFTELSDLGKNDWWRYALSIFFILTVWQVVGAIPYAVAYIMGWTQNIFVNYLGLSFSFVCFFFAILFAVRVIHRRPFLSLVTPTLRMDIPGFFLSLGLWTVISLVTTLGDALLHPGSYRWTFAWPGWLLFSLLALVFTTLQTSAEELFFRGYLLQSFARAIHSRWVLLVLSGIVFAVPHFLNPEMSVDFGLLALFYFGFGFFLAWVTIRYDRLEYALGIHAANNLWAVVIANYNGSSLPSISLFTSSGLDALYNLISLLVGAAVYLLILRGLSTVEKPAIPDAGSDPSLMR